MTAGVPSGGERWLERIWARIYDHLVQPFLETHDPLPRVAWGASVGWLVSMTPLMGIQMYIVALLWVICRYLLRLRFNLTIAISLVWLTNPVTIVPLYFLFLHTGDVLLTFLGYEVRDMTFELFRQQVAQLTPRHAGDSWGQWLLAAGQVVLMEFGWPMALGSLVYAVPGAVLAYPVTYVVLRHYRQYLAELNGISYAEWRERYETKR
jgi:hypothetical protein